jgi:hypothetical protein
MRKEETPICAKTGIVMPLLIFKILCTNSGEFSLFLMNYQGFIPKVKSYLCCYQSPKNERLKVHLDP